MSTLAAADTYFNRVQNTDLRRALDRALTSPNDDSIESLECYADLATQQDVTDAVKLMRDLTIELRDPSRRSATPERDKRDAGLLDQMADFIDGRGTTTYDFTAYEAEFLRVFARNPYKAPAIRDAAQTELERRGQTA